MQLLATSDGLQHHIDANLPIRNAPPILIQADHVESAQPPIVELPGVADEPSYHIVLAPKRGARPRTSGGQNAASDPLAIDAVRGRGQHFFLYAILETLILLLANPFPYARECATWAFMGLQMVPQLTGSRDAQCLRKLFQIMLALAQEMPNAMFGFNAVAGNSLQRLHFVSHVPAPEIGLYAVQRVAARQQRSAVCVLGPEQGYPIEVVRIAHETSSCVVAVAVDFLARLHARGATRTFNAAVAVEAGMPVLYIAPRDSELRPAGWSAQFGFMEMLGVGIASDEAIAGRVRDTSFAHADWVRAISSLRLPTVRDLI